MQKDIALISACLLGIECRYDGKSKPTPLLQQLYDKYQLIPICPEQLGGLPTPRPPAEIIGGDGLDVLLGRAVVKNNRGIDVTKEFLKGAFMSLKLANIFHPKKCLLKAKSPSCGIYKKLGVTAALFIKSKFQLIEID